jgi:hypothetical protein
VAPPWSRQGQSPWNQLGLNLYGGFSCQVISCAFFSFSVPANQYRHPRSERHPKAGVIVPPRITAVADETTVTQRDKHLTTIAEHGRMSWQRSSGYNRRSLAETTMFRYKTVIDRRLHARTLPNQRTEAKVGCNVLNRMTGLGMPVSARIR